MASGLTGEEVVDVYVNNFSSPCEIGAKVPLRSEPPQLFRYVLCPMNATISCLLIQVRHASSPPRSAHGNPSIFHGNFTTPKSASGMGRTSDTSSSMVIIDPTVGVRIAMQDCLASTALVNPGNGSPAQAGVSAATYSESAKGKVLLRTGQWRFQGLYRLLPYLCTKKPYRSKRQENGSLQSSKDMVDTKADTRISLNEETLLFSSAGEAESLAIKAV